MHITINPQDHTTRIILSLIVLVLLLILTVSIVLLIRRAVIKKTAISIIIAVMSTIIITPIIVLYASYAYPFDVYVDIEFVDAIELKSTNKVSNDKRDWYCLYDYQSSFIDLMASEELLLDNGAGGTKFTFLEVSGECPKADFDRYTYLVSKGYEVKSLKYNVWDCKGPPLCDLNLGPKWGIAELSQNYDSKIYIYRFPKKAINNPEGTKYEERNIYKINLFN